MKSTPYLQRACKHVNVNFRPLTSLISPYVEKSNSIQHDVLDCWPIAAYHGMLKLCNSLL